MPSRTVLSLFVASGLFGLYVVYALAMNSMIGVQTLGHIKPLDMPPPQPPLDSLRLAERYLVPSSPWVLNDAAQIRTAKSFDVPVIIRCVVARLRFQYDYFGHTFSSLCIAAFNITPCELPT